jgi:hypothetical protein
VKDKERFVSNESDIIKINKKNTEEIQEYNKRLKVVFSKDVKKSFEESIKEDK